MGKFYHRTSRKNWKLIKKEGVLWGIPKYCSYRFTYLAPYDIGKSYGEILLEVEYEPKKEDFGLKHNYGFNPPKGEICWQFSVFEPILKFKRISPLEAGQEPQIY